MRQRSPWPIWAIVALLIVASSVTIIRQLVNKRLVISDDEPSALSSGHVVEEPPPVETLFDDSLMASANKDEEIIVRDTLNGATFILDHKISTLVRQSSDGEQLWSVNVFDYVAALPPPLDKESRRGPVQLIEVKDGLIYLKYGLHSWVSVSQDTGEIKYLGSD